MPAYTASEAAHYLTVPVSTIRYWAVGRDNREPLIEPADVDPLCLSFVNLVELHVLAALRRRYRLPMPAIRDGLDYVERQLQQKRPLASRRFQTDGVDLFVEHFGQLINVSRGGQTAMKDVLRAALFRVQWDNKGLPVRLYPYTRTGEGASAELIVIDPAISGGRAVISGTRIPVEVIAERYKTGESISELAKDYGRRAEEIEEAIRCELPIAA